MQYVLSGRSPSKQNVTVTTPVTTAAKKALAGVMDSPPPPLTPAARSRSGPTSIHWGASRMPPLPKRAGVPL